MSHSRLTDEQTERANSRIRSGLLFADLDSHHIDEIVSRLGSAELDETDVLFHQEEPAHEFFLLESGSIKLARSSTEGHEKVIELISPGETFAEAVMFSNNQRFPVTATALGESQVWCVDATHYVDILRESADTCFAVMAQMSRRLHFHVAEIDRLTMHNAAFRLVSFLLDQIPSTSIGASVVQLDTPKHVIASRLSITPETLSRTFAKLTADELIEIDDHTVILHDLERLRFYLQGKYVLP